VALAASFVYTIDTHECLLDLLFVSEAPASAQGATSRESVRAYTAGRGQIQSANMLEVLAAIAPSEPGAFEALARAVVARRESLSSVILILLDWDEERRKLAEALLAAGASVRALLVCARDARPAGMPGWVLALHPGEIEAGLAGLR